MNVFTLSPDFCCWPTKLVVLFTTTWLVVKRALNCLVIMTNLGVLWQHKNEGVVIVANERSIEKEGLLNVSLVEEVGELLDNSKVYGPSIW